MEDRQSPVEGNGTKAAAISNGAVHILSQYTGRGPTKARTTISEDHVLIVMADTLTKGERTLVKAGCSERVLQVRSDFQSAMSQDLVALVEGQIDRKVVAFMSNNNIDPDLGVEIFVLSPGLSVATAAPEEQVRIAEKDPNAASATVGIRHERRLSDAKAGGWNWDAPS